MGLLAKSLYEEADHSRKAVATLISKHRLCFIGYKCIDMPSVTGREFVREMPLSRICKLIPDYEDENMEAVFQK